MDLFDLKITGCQLVLRLLTVEDVHSFLEYLNRNRDFHQPFSPTMPDDYCTLENAFRIVNQYASVERDEQYLFGMFDKESNELVGKIRLSSIVRRAFQSANLSYDVDQSRQKRGYTTEAVQMLTAYALYGLDLHRIQASIMPRNVASQKVVEKAGYIREGYSEKYISINGVWEDHFTYAMTRERYETLPLEWKKQGIVEL